MSRWNKQTVAQRKRRTERTRVDPENNKQNHLILPSTKTVFRSGQKYDPPIELGKKIHLGKPLRSIRTANIEKTNKNKNSVAFRTYKMVWNNFTSNLFI